MEHARGQRKTRLGSVLHSGWPGVLMNAGRDALPWLGLLTVSAAAAHAMQVGVESISEKADSAASTAALSSRAADLRAAPPQRVVVVINFVDASGNDQQLECMTTADRLASDTLSVYLDDIQAVEAELCESSPT